VDGILAGLDAVDWPSLRHAYGAADDTPGLLRGVLAGDEDAFFQLLASIYHQGGGVYSAAAAAAPFLIDLGCEPTVTTRGYVLELLGRLAALLSELATAGRSDPDTVALRAAMEAALPRFLALLGDPDADIREAAIEVVSVCDFGTDRIGRALRDRFAVESEDWLRVKALLAFHDLAEAMTDADRAECQAWAAGIAEPPLLLAAFIACEKLVPGSVPTARMFAALEHPELVPDLYVRGASSAADLVGWVAFRVEDAGGLRRLAQWSLEPLHAGTSGLEHVGNQLLHSRQATVELLPDIVALLDHSSAAVRAGAAHLVAASAGSAVAPFADRLAALADDAGTEVATRAIWALARLGDERAVPYLVEAIDGVSDRFDNARVHYGRLFFQLDDPPALADVLPPMRTHAEELMPALRRRLTRATSLPELSSLAEVFAAWGPAARGAVPELRALLSGPQPELVSEMLGRIGGEAPAAAEELGRLAGSADLAGVAPAWAYFRVTGDPELLLRCVDLTRGLSGAHSTFSRLGDLGAHAVGHAQPIAALLTGAPDYWPTWTGAEAAYAHWRITGDSALCLTVFEAALEPLHEGKQLPVSRQVLRHLPALGPAAAVFAPVLRAVVTSPDRLLYNGGWRGIAEDDEAVELARVALAALDAD
jgi:HEAT repeat protein